MSKTFHHPDSKNTEFINRRRRRWEKRQEEYMPDIFDSWEDITPNTKKEIWRIMKRARRWYRFLLECNKIIEDLLTIPTKLQYNPESRQSVFSGYSIEKINQLILGNNMEHQLPRNPANNLLLLEYTPIKPLSNKSIERVRARMYAMLIMLYPTPEQLTIQKAHQEYKKWIELIETAALTSNNIPDSIQDNSPYSHIPKP